MTEVWLVERYIREIRGTRVEGLFSSRKLAVDFCVDQGWHAGMTFINPWVVDNV